MRRVVITGLGMVSSLATGLEASWSKLLKGESGVKTITRFDTSKMKTKVAAEVNDFTASDFISVKLVRRTDPIVHYSLATSIMAVEDANINLSSEDLDKFGVIGGTCNGGVKFLEDAFKSQFTDDFSSLNTFFGTGFLPNMPAAEISLLFKLRGPQYEIVSACTTGTLVLGNAYRNILYGDADVMIAVSTDAYVAQVAVLGMEKLGALTAWDREPSKASRPFDKTRDGFVLGEGSAALVLEDLEHALRRGARIYGEILGFSHNTDGFHITAGKADVKGRCITNAIKTANIPLNQIDYINAHGTSTRNGDMVETEAIKLALGEYAYKIPISSNKSMMGHPLAAAGTIEAAFTLLSIRDSIIPPTINLNEPDEQCDLDYVPNILRKANIDVALSNSFGFGGSNAVIVLSKYRG
jgi:3-oxoacyl-[acyl-carrier-protein] synthase II